MTDVRPGFPHRKGRLGIAGLLALVFGASIVAPPRVASADVVADAGVALGTPRYYTSAVWAEQAAYVIGGYQSGGGNIRSDEIARYDPSTNTVTVVARLPVAMELTKAIWDGSRVDIFGGDSATGYSNKIYRFDPTTNTVTTSAATLPFARYLATAAWDGINAYLFGGFWNNSGNPGNHYGYTDQILRYNPVADSVTVMNAKLPSAGTDPAAVLQPHAAVSDGTDVYTFGGGVGHCSGVGCATSFSTILRYSPATDSIVAHPSSLPKPNTFPSAVFDGQNAYIFGGTGPDAAQRNVFRDIVRFNPASGVVTTMNGTLNSGRWASSAVWTGSRALMFGGVSFDEGIRSDILSYDPATDQSAVLYGLPTIRQGTSTAYQGGLGYIIGGERHSSTGYMEGPNTQIVRYDPNRREASVMPTHLPRGLTDTAAVSNGSDVYVFGGLVGVDMNGNTGASDEIIRYSPANDGVTVMDAKLPGARSGLSAVWSGNAAYVFGGSASMVSPSRADYDDIVRYDPVTDQTTTMNAKLPAGRRFTAAVWTGTRAIIFGGSPSNGSNVASYDPLTDTISTTGVTIPEMDSGFSAVWDGQEALIFGGLKTGSQWYGTVYAYNPTTNTLTQRAATLPTGGRWRASAFWHGNAAFIVGGCCRSSSEYQNVLRFDYRPGAPAGTSALTGPSRGQIRFVWQSPPSNAIHSPVVAYRVYRGTSPSSLSFVSQVPPTTFEHSDTGLPDVVSRHYQVSAVTAEGEGERSAVVTGTTAGLPTVPLAVSATSGPAAGQIKVAWSPPADRGGVGLALQYKIYRSSVPGGGTLYATLDETQEFVDQGLADGSVWYYQVSVANVFGEGPRSGDVSARAPEPPSAPRNLTSAFQAQGQTKLTWQAPINIGGPPALAAYRLYRHDITSGYTIVATISGPFSYGSTTTYFDTSCSLGRICYYRVAAFNGAYEGPWSNEVMAPGTALP